jgi:hypothetical protein
MRYVHTKFRENRSGGSTVQAVYTETHTSDLCVTCRLTLRAILSVSWRADHELRHFSLTFSQRKVSDGFPGTFVFFARRNTITNVATTARVLEAQAMETARVCLYCRVQTSLQGAYELIISFYGEKSQCNNIPAVPEVKFKVQNMR